MAKKKIDAKELGLNLLLGVAVMIFTGMFATPFISLWDAFAFEIIPGVISIGTAVIAGTSAFLTNLAIDKWFR